MGFIKEDLRSLTEKNIEEVKYRVSKYSNFISRVIYDMKWFDPPLQTIRGNIYNTNLNEVLKFVVNNIFLRISRISDAYKFELNLDERLPDVNVNEFVVWEIFEPLIQNSVDHSGESDLVIIITTCFNQDTGTSTISISDNGKGIKPEFLQKDEKGIKKLFLENVTSKSATISGGGYGCYIAYEISRRCGWNLDAENLPGSGSNFIINISNNK
jgi:signal transduction histidine kinase